MEQLPLSAQVFCSMSQSARENITGVTNFPIDWYHFHVTLYIHYNSAMLCQITGNLTVCSAACSGQLNCLFSSLNTPKLRITGTSWGESTGNRWISSQRASNGHDDVNICKHIPRYWPFVRGYHRSPVNSPQKGQWRGASMFSLIRPWINGWANSGEAGNLRRHRAHYDVTVIDKPFRVMTS